MNIDLLRVFVTIAELRSMTKAAAALDTMQPIISRSLSNLERELGGRLFHRTGRGVELSAIGEALLPDAIQLIRQSEALFHKARSFDETTSGTVRIGMIEALATPLVPRLFERMRRDHPQVMLKIFIGSIGRVEEWLSEGTIDLAINLGDGDSQMGDARRLHTLDSYLVGLAGDPVVAADTIDFARLADLPLVLSATPVGLRAKIDRVAEELKVPVRPLIQVDMLKVHLDLVRAGGIYAILTSLAFAEGCLRGELAVAKIVGPSIKRDIMIGTSLRSMPTLATKRTASILQEACQELLGREIWEGTPAH